MSFYKISEKDNSSENKEGLGYTFSENEIELLAKFFRQNQTSIPRGLEKFARDLELHIYDVLSIEEVEKLFR